MDGAAAKLHHRMPARLAFDSKAPRLCGALESSGLAAHIYLILEQAIEDSQHQAWGYCVRTKAALLQTCQPSTSLVLYPNGLVFIVSN